MEMSAGFSKGFQEIQNKVMAMGDMATKDINRSIEALKNRDLKMAHQIIADDTKIDDMRFVIEDMCIEIMGTQKLTITDRRIIVAVINIVTELERIGDYGKSVV